MILGTVLNPDAILANPKGDKVVAGSADFSTVGDQLNVRTSDRAIINWDQFNIAPNETTRFIQPGSGSLALNRILDSNPSTIFGTLQANGNIVLLNGNGVIFGPNSKVNVNGLIATSLSIEDQAFLNGKYKFVGHDQNGAVKNYGTIETLTGGFAYLLAPDVENNGIIRSPEGHIALAAGTKAYLSNRPDGKGLLVEVQAPAGEAVNLRDLIADGGEISFYGQAINQSGLVQADTAEEKNGEIRLVASKRVYFEEGSETVARGAPTGVSDGGSIVAVSGGGGTGETGAADVIFKEGALVDVSGGPEGGDAGSAELSASGGMILDGDVRGDAAPGYKGGELLIDPVNVTIRASGANGAPVVDPPGTGTVAFDSPTLPDNLTLSTSSSFSGLSIIRVEATNNISIATAWNLQPLVEELTLRAGNDISFTTGSSIRASSSGEDFRLNLVAGADFGGSDLFDVTPGVGRFLNPLIEIGDGQIKAVTGNGINVSGGAIRTTKGGSIDLTAVEGGISAGTNNAFLEPVGSVALRLPIGGVGGIGTQAGGDILLNAPHGEISSSFSHIGAYSSGDLTIRARDFTGQFFVNGGHADVRLTGNFGMGIRTTTIDLANDGSAYVEAANIKLGQIRNPRGALTLNHFFDYGDDAKVQLVATTGDLLLAGDVGAGNTDGINVDRILAPTLEATALQGDILIGHEFVLFPSPTGNLVLKAFGDITNNFSTTLPVRTDSVPPNPLASPFATAPPFIKATGVAAVFNDVYPVIALSDSDPNPLRLDPTVPNGPAPKPDYTRDLFKYYALTHTSTPLHANDPEPVQISAGGDISRVGFALSKPATFEVGGDLRNIALYGQNIHPDDVTRFNITGNLDWRRFVGDYEGFPILVNGNDRDARSTIIRIGGPGTLEMKIGGFADLGESEGIQSVAKLFNPNLDDNSPGIDDDDRSDDGASINIVVGPDELGGMGTPVMTPKGLVNRQDLVMVNSRIATFGGGDIDVTVNNGSLLVGAGTIGLVDSLLPRGLYTASGGEINLLALQNVDVLTSRVASFDGGDINITAVEGNINAGEGKLDQTTEVPGVSQGSVAFKVEGTGIVTDSRTAGRTPGSINLTAGTEVRTGSAGITCKGQNASACSINISGNVALGPGGITSGGSVSISGNVSGIGSISGGAVNISGSAGGASISASSGSGAVTSAASGSTVATETALVAKAVDVSTTSSGNEEDDLKRKGHKRKKIRRGVIIEVTAKPAA